MKTRWLSPTPIPLPWLWLCAFIGPQEATGKARRSFFNPPLSVPPIPQPPPTKSHRLSSVQDAMVVRGQGSWALGGWKGSCIPCPWLGEKQEDGLVADRKGKSGVQGFTPSPTQGLGFLTSPKPVLRVSGLRRQARGEGWQTSVGKGEHTEHPLLVPSVIFLLQSPLGSRSSNP